LAKGQATAARLHSQLIDRGHPLWEFHVFDDIRPPRGLQFSGRLAGFYSKIHHAALDGKGGTVLANAILDLSPQPREVPPPSRKAGTGRELKVGEMIGAVFSNSLAQYAKLARALPGAASKVTSAVAGSEVRSGSALPSAPHTPFNAGIDAQRAFATASLPFEDCRALARSIGGSFNDIVLWICSTALRHYLAGHGMLPRKSLVAAMPVSLRDGSNKEMNNQASMSLVQLGTQHADALKRMNAITESTGKVKTALSGLKSIIPTDYPSLLSPWLGGAARGLFRTYGKGSIAQHLPAFANVVISNVPGPQVPLYLAGARMLTFHPMSIVIHGIALNITIQTYAGSVDFGIIAGAKAVPDVEAVARAIQGAFEEARTTFGAPPRPSEAGATPAARRVRKSPGTSPAGAGRAGATRTIRKPPARRKAQS
jgi:WS/DGAT/MGAT family acyltransferase